MSGGGQGMQTGGGQPPMMGGQPGGRPPMMGPGGPGGFREGSYGGGGGMLDQMRNDPRYQQMVQQSRQPPGGFDDTQRNPMIGGVKGPMGGQMPEDYLRMMQQQQQRQQQGLLGQPMMQAGDGLPPGVSMGMSPPRMPPLQPGGGNEMAQIMAQYGR